MCRTQSSRYHFHQSHSCWRPYPGHCTRIQELCSNTEEKFRRRQVPRQPALTLVRTALEFRTMSRLARPRWPDASWCCSMPADFGVRMRAAGGQLYGDSNSPPPNPGRRMGGARKRGLALLDTWRSCSGPGASVSPAVFFGFHASCAPSPPTWRSASCRIAASAGRSFSNRNSTLNGASSPH